MCVLLLLCCHALVVVGNGVARLSVVVPRALTELEQGVVQTLRPLGYLEIVEGADLIWCTHNAIADREQQNLKSGAQLRRATRMRNSFLAWSAQGHLCISS